MTNIPEDYLKLIQRIDQMEQTLSTLVSENTSAHGVVNELELIDNTDLKAPKSVIVSIDPRAHLKMVLHSKKYANASIPQKDWVEVIGLLTGHVINEGTPLEQLIVNDAWPVGHGDAVSVSIMETKSFTDIVQQVANTNDYIIGWYHSHPSYGRFLSIDDYETHSRYQRLWNKSIAIVVDPTEVNKNDYGFSVFRNTDAEKELKQSYTELSSEVVGTTTKAAHDIITLIQPALNGKANQYFRY